MCACKTLITRLIRSQINSLFFIRTVSFGLVEIASRFCTVCLFYAHFFSVPRFQCNRNHHRNENLKRYTVWSVLLNAIAAKVLFKPFLWLFQQSQVDVKCNTQHLRMKHRLLARSSYQQTNLLNSLHSNTMPVTIHTV